MKGNGWQYYITTNSGKSGVIPTTNKALLDEPMEFPFGKKSVYEIKTTASKLVCENVKERKVLHLKSQIFTFLSSRASIIHWYCGLRSRYSFVLKAWVTPSIESTAGQAKS